MKEKLEAVNQISLKIAEILEQKKLLSEIVHLIQEKFQYQCVKLFLSEDNSNDLILQACSGQDEEQIIGTRLRVRTDDDKIVSRVALSGQVIFDNNLNSLLFDTWELKGKPKSALAIPLKFGEKILGVLVVQSKFVNTFQIEDITANQIICNQLAVALEKTRLYQETCNQLESMNILHDISVDISSKLELQQVLAAIARQAAHLLHADGSNIAVCEPETDFARIVALYNVPLKYEQLILKPGTSAIAEVLVTGEPVIINEKQNDLFINVEGDNGYPSDPSYDGVLSVPLLWKDQIVGILTVLHQGNRQAFTEEDIRFLSLLANLASVALNNSQLYSQVIQLNQKLEHTVDEITTQLAKTREKLTQKTEQLQRALANTVYLQEEERTRIAFDLHDGSNQLITGTLYEIQAAQQVLKGGRQELALDKLETAIEYLRKIELENRRIIAGLRPPGLDTKGLIDALQRQTEFYQQYSETSFTVQISGDIIRLTSHVEMTIFRIIQESINNALKHAQAQNIIIRLKFHPAYLRVEIIDDGEGFEIDKDLISDRVGLIGMRERAYSIGGRLEIKSQFGQGTRIILDLPLPAPHISKIIPMDLNQYDNQNTEYLNFKLSQTNKKVNKNSKAEKLQKQKINALAEAIANLENDKAYSLVKANIIEGINPTEILNKGIMYGLKIVGKRFEENYYYLGELMIGANIAEKCTNILHPYLPKRKKIKQGVLVIGAVSGDTHSIGYGLVARQLEFAGYEVHDLGVNIPSMDFIAKAQELGADIIAVSAFLITTSPCCKEIITNLCDLGLRENFKVIIGGSETNQSFSDSIGADGWALNATDAVKLCNRLMLLNKNKNKK